MPPKAAGKAKVKKDKNEEVLPGREAVQEPDRDSFEKATGEIQTAIDTLIKKQQALTAEIAKQSEGKEEFYKKKNDLYTKINAFKEKIDAIKMRKDKVSQAISGKRQEDANMKLDLSKAKRSLRYETEEDIDRRIAEINYQQVTETLSIAAEKALMAELAELRKSRPALSKVKQMEKDFASRQPAEDLRAQRDDIASELNAYTDGKKKVQAELKELLEAKKTDLDELQKLYTDRDALRGQIDEKKAEREKIRSEFKEKEREYNAYLREIRDERNRKWQEDQEVEKAKRALADRERSVADKVNPHVNDQVLLEQSILFCKNLINRPTEVVVEKKEVEHDLPEGAVVFKKEEEFFFAPTKGKKVKGKKKETSKNVIKHNAITFELFNKLGLAAPINTEEVPGVLELLDARLEEVKLKVEAYDNTFAERKAKYLAGEITQLDDPIES